MATAKQGPEKKTIKPGRDIVASKADSLAKKMLKIFEQGTKELVMDMGQVHNLDSVGLSVIIAAHNAMSTAGGKLTLINASEEISSIFTAIHLDQQFEVRTG